MANADMIELIKWFASLGVGGTLAWGMFLVYRKDTKQALATTIARQAEETDKWRDFVKNREDKWEHLTNGIRQDRSVAIEVIKENTAAVTACVAATRQQSEMLIEFRNLLVHALQAKG